MPRLGVCQLQTFFHQILKKRRHATVTGLRSSKSAPKTPKVVVLDADLSGSTKTKKFSEKYPERFFNYGVAEQNLIGHAAGFALSGLIPVASSFAMFASGRAWEILRNSVCYPHLNVKVAATHAGITLGEDGASHQIIEDIALTRVIPGLVCAGAG
jgi:transketolase